MSFVKIGITSGLRGTFATMYDEDGPIQTSPMSYKNSRGAIQDAIAWAKAEFGDDWKYHCDFKEIPRDK